jgi:hypothetical protein
MLIDCGQAYTITQDNVSVGSSSTADIVQLQTSSTVPVLVTRIVMTANQTSATIQRVTLLRRSAGSTGGSAANIYPLNGGSSSASSSAVYNATTVSGAGNIIDSQQWNEFAPYEFNIKPAGILVPVSSYLSLFYSATPGTGFSASFTVELVELK